jgi:hypothetical protein
MKMGWDRVGLTSNAVRCIKAVLIGYAALRRAVECVCADFVAALGVGRTRLNSCCGGGCEGEASHCEEAEEVGGEHFGMIILRFVRSLSFLLSRFVLLVSFVFVNLVGYLDCKGFVKLIARSKEKIQLKRSAR